MADQETDPHDDAVRSVPLPSDDAEEPDRVIAQENQSAEVALGGGGWPSPGTPPSGPAPGVVDHDRTGDVEPPADEEADAFPPMRPVLEHDPVAAGSKSVPRTDDADRAEEAGGTKYA